MVCGSCGEWDLRCIQVAMLGNHSAWWLQRPGVLICEVAAGGSCGAWEPHVEGAAVGGSCSGLESRLILAKDEQW